MDHQDWKSVTIGSVKSKSTSNNQNDIKYKPSTLPKYKEDENGIPIKRSFPKDFGQKMQQARASKGWSQKELAQKLNTGLAVVQDYEQNKVANPNRSFARKIETLLDAKLL